MKSWLLQNNEITVVCKLILASMWLPGGMEYNWVLDGNTTIITFDIRPNATITKFDVSPNHIKRAKRSGAAGCSSEAAVRRSVAASVKI